MPPDDPLGRHGPSLENFLRKRPVIPEHRKQPCPYGKKALMYTFIPVSEALQVYDCNWNFCHLLAHIFSCFFVIFKLNSLIKKFK